MGLGILEPRNTTAHVPGTVILDEQVAHSESDTGLLKHGTGADAHIVLSPQPSEDPNDPLNWSGSKKMIVLLVLCFGSIVNSGCQGPLLAAGAATIAGQFHQSITPIVKISGYQLLVVGATGPFVSALTRKFGRRPMFLLSSLFGVIGCILGECASGYKTLLTARVIAGFSTTGYESVLVAAIGDLYFVHQRGSRVSWVFFILTGVSSGASIIAGRITYSLGWRYNFHILMPFIALQFILLFFLSPETAYNRQEIYNTDTAQVEDYGKLAAIEHHLENRDTTKEDVSLSQLEKTTTTTSSYAPPARKTYIQSLAIYTGTYTHDSYIKMIIAPFAILTNLGACWLVFVSGLSVAWFVGVTFISSQILSAPPYHFNAAQVGYCSTGPFIGAVIASVALVIGGDPLTKRLSRANGGVYEPELRIPPVIFAAICTVVGLVGLGHSVENGASIYLVCFCWGIMVFGVGVAGISTASYALDAFREHSTEMFVVNMMFKNFFFYGVSNFVNNWVAESGPAAVLDIMAGISAALYLTSIPMYVYGKRYRLFWSQHNVLRMLRLETKQDLAG